MELIMLSDKFLNDREYNDKSNLSKQIQRLEELSITMTNLVENGNHEKIVHLDKIRQKILKDIIKKGDEIQKDLRPKILNIINLSNNMKEKMKAEKSKSLKNIKTKIKCIESYNKF